MSETRRITLRELIQAEGAAKTLDELSSEVVVAAEACGYSEGMTLVITRYKPYAARRYSAKNFGQNNENLDPQSVQDFRWLAGSFEETASLHDGKPVIKALHLHNAASCTAKVNGNVPEEQKRYNLEALRILQSVPEADRNDDWQVVYEKIYFGLTEAGHIPFDQAQCEAIINAMPGKSKDLAGRRAFLAQKWAQAGNLDEAIRVLLPVESDTHSAPNQVESAKKLLEKYLAQKANCI